MDRATSSIGQSFIPPTDLAAPLAIGDELMTVSVTKPKSSGFTQETSTRERFQSSTRARSIWMRRADTSRRDRRVMQPATMRLLSVRTQARAGTTLVRRRCRRSPVQRRVGAISVVVALELEELHLQVGARPKERPIHALQRTTSCSGIAAASRCANRSCFRRSCSRPQKPPGLVE